jgi:hypothetical protein
VSHRRRLEAGQGRAEFSQSQRLNSLVWARPATSRSVPADQPAIVRFASFADRNRSSGTITGVSQSPSK